jgi:hypothetical protein
MLNSVRKFRRHILLPFLGLIVLWILYILLFDLPKGYFSIVPLFGIFLIWLQNRHLCKTSKWIIAVLSKDTLQTDDDNLERLFVQNAPPKLISNAFNEFVPLAGCCLAFFLLEFVPWYIAFPIGVVITLVLFLLTKSMQVSWAEFGLDGAIVSIAADAGEVSPEKMQQLLDHFAPYHRETKCVDLRDSMRIVNYLKAEQQNK